MYSQEGRLPNLCISSWHTKWYLYHVCSMRKAFSATQVVRFRKRLVTFGFAADVNPTLLDESGVCVWRETRPPTSAPLLDFLISLIVAYWRRQVEAHLKPCVCFKGCVLCLAEMPTNMTKWQRLTQWVWHQASATLACHQSEVAEAEWNSSVFYSISIWVEIIQTSSKLFVLTSFKKVRSIIIMLS